MIGFTLVATLAALIFIGTTGWMTFSRPVLTPQSWIIPATLSMVFLALTLYSVVSEGISAHWPSTYATPGATRSGSIFF